MAYNGKNVRSEDQEISQALLGKGLKERFISEISIWTMVEKDTWTMWNTFFHVCVQSHFLLCGSAAHNVPGIVNL